MPDVIIRPLDIAQDAEKVAAMWNGSDLQWPGSWTDGVPITAENVREWERNRRHLIVYVAEVGDEIAGYCSFMTDHHGLENEGYLALLNVHPKFQKMSIGRRLIQATIERSVQEGWKRQTLGTWSANFKAVPTYKKTGHFWTPDSSVWMQNFIPGALQMALAKPFFAKHDWYSCYVRELTQEWDDQRWEGLKVFTEHWDAAGEALTIWIDREARAPVAVETDALQVAAIASDIEPLAGSAAPIKWRVINKSAEPIQVYLHALGDEGLSIDHRDAFVVPAGQTVERVGEVKVAATASREKDDGTAPAVRSIIRLNNDEVELFSGLRVKKPLSVDTSPDAICLRPGAASAIQVQLHSEMKDKATARVYLTLPEGLQGDWSYREVELGPEAHASLPLTLTAAREGVYSLAGRLERDGAEGEAFSWPIFCLAAGGMIAQRDGKSVRIETDALRVNVAASEGQIKVEDKATNYPILSLSPLAGPPYWPSATQKKDFELTLEERDGRAHLHLWAESKYDKGLYIHEEISFAPTGLGEVRCYLENRGSQPITRSLRLSARSADRELETYVFPLKCGLVRSAGGLYPVREDDAPRDPAGYAEPWIAWEHRGATAGVAWGAATQRLDIDWSATCDPVDLALAPGERSAAACYAFYAGSGDWRASRRALLAWANKPALPEPQPRPVYRALVEPQVMATVSPTATARLIVDAASNHKANGEVRIMSADGLTVEPAQVAIADLERGHSLEREVAIRLPEGRLGAFHGEAALDLTLVSQCEVFTILRLGDERAVEVSQGEQAGREVWTIRNGAHEFVVAPGYGPSMVAWNYQGVNQLCSGFPEPMGFGWVYPYFGGIHAILVPGGFWGDEGYLHREQFTAQAIEVRDAQGLLWRGVRLSGRPERRELHDLAIELDYLTLGASNVLKYVYRLRNLRDARQTATMGSRVACSLGGKITDVVLRGEGITRQPAPWAAWQMEREWGAVTQPSSGCTMLMVGQRADVGLLDMGQYGRLLGVHSEVKLAANETKEYVYYLALADSFAAAEQYIALKNYKG